MLDALDAAAVRRWSRAALDSMRAHQGEIDALNVFPVPDGDTGTNLMLTLLVADDAAQSCPADAAGGVLAELARAAVLGARGNSGVILSQYFRGLAEAAGDAATVDGETFARGLRRGADLADAAVAEPVDGTILTVAHAAAGALDDAAGKPFADLVDAALTAATAALAHTREQLPALTAAGVVDAGARGFVVVLEALAGVLSGASVASQPASSEPTWTALSTAREAGSPEFAYEVQYLLDAPELDPDALRGALLALGDSVAVVGTGEGTWNVHVHVNDVGAALEAGMTRGRPHRVTVIAFADQTSASAAHANTEDIAVVAVSPGPGLDHLFGTEGVNVVSHDPPDAAHVLAAMQATGCGEVVVLATGAAAARAAEAGARLARDGGTRVAVVPTRSPVQALAAVAVHDANRRFDDDVVAMAEAAAATRFAEIVVATEQALTSVGMCEPGDVLGLIDGEVVEIGHGVLAVALALTDRLLGVGAELLTIVTGLDAPASLGETLARHVRNRAPLTDLAIYPGSHPLHPVIIGAE